MGWAEFRTGGGASSRECARKPLPTILLYVLQYREELGIYFSNMPKSFRFRVDFVAVKPCDLGQKSLSAVVR